ncbi:hypothetical protein CPB83DRAFT_136092 [Crepidotus variabilis]|uniref:Uncharacterized protein n=1 Tax=Crepidotus variabilis TaxID=179855 RepID=A0A9P6E479_9AGAR|nr:hypothetical protein CPB83DRAFT_136092 [Crepidotus variabilis]
MVRIPIRQFHPLISTPSDLASAHAVLKHGRHWESERRQSVEAESPSRRLRKVLDEKSREDSWLTRMFGPFQHQTIEFQISRLFVCCIWACLSMVRAVLWITTAEVL